jgi:hypothetical protein
MYRVSYLSEINDEVIVVAYVSPLLGTASDKGVAPPFSYGLTSWSDTPIRVQEKHHYAVT